MGISTMSVLGTMKIKTLTVRIITGNAEYIKVLKTNQLKVPIWKLGFETMKQLESEQWLSQNGFVKVQKMEK